MKKLLLAAVALPAAFLLVLTLLVVVIIGGSDEEEETQAVAAVAGQTPGGAGMIGAEFRAGNIISDELFYNSSAMTVDQIREFINTQGEGCAGAACLRTVRFTTVSQPADDYCAEYAGGTDEDTATIISKFSVACGVNPQVMLVTLQKESQLLGRTDTSMSNYNAAWGWFCPDTGPGGSANCDSTHAGFFNQGYGMAKQWSRYRKDPDKYNYQAGETTEILWNVAESGCGGAPVTIENTATASLYNYTPYQPNAASLAAYPGTGDGCSSYGNRNFFFMFGKYFGTNADTPAGDGSDASPGGSGVQANGPSVTIPNNPNVVEALRGKTITAPSAAVAKGLAAGFGALGLPYVWGGGNDGGPANNGCQRGGGELNSCGSTIGFDCSGLTGYVLKNAGFQIPGNSGGQRAAGMKIPWSQGLPGDIVGFSGHVAIYLGTIDGTPYILEASEVGVPIHVVPLTRTRDRDSVFHRYWS